MIEILDITIFSFTIIWSILAYMKIPLLIWNCLWFWKISITRYKRMEKKYWSR